MQLAAMGIIVMANYLAINFGAFLNLGSLAAMPGLIDFDGNRLHDQAHCRFSKSIPRRRQEVWSFPSVTNFVWL